MIGRVAWLWRCVLSAFGGAIEPVAMARANSRLRSQSLSDDDVSALSDEDISQFLQADGIRAKDLDEKLQKLTATLSVAVTIGGLAGQTMLGELDASELKSATAIAFLVAELYLIFGVVVGFDGLRPRPRYGYGPGFLRIMAEGGDQKRKELVGAANASMRDNIMRANQASAAATAIRNGILVFAIAVLLGLIAAALGASSSDHADKAAATGCRYSKVAKTPLSPPATSTSPLPSPSSNADPKNQVIKNHLNPVPAAMSGQSVETNPGYKPEERISLPPIAINEHSCPQNTSAKISGSAGGQRADQE